MPTISVILPVYNAEPYLRDCLQSLLKQRDVDLEIVAVDDGSTDGSLKILEDFAAHHPALRVFTQPNAGGAAARNRSIAEANGELFMLQDADDVSHPERARMLLEYLRHHPTIDMVGSASWIISESGSILAQIRPPTAPSEIAARMPTSIAYCHASVMFRANVFRGPNGVRYDESLISAHDYDMLLRAHEQHRGANLRQPLYAYRFSGNQLSIRHVEGGAYRAYVAAYSARNPDYSVSSSDRLDRDQVLALGATPAEIDAFMVGRFRYAVHMMMLSRRGSALAGEIEEYLKRWKPDHDVRQQLQALHAVATLCERHDASAFKRSLGALMAAGAGPVAKEAWRTAKFLAHVARVQLRDVQWRPPTARQ